MLILYRKAGQGIEIKNKQTGDTYDFDFICNSNPIIKCKVNGKEKGQSERYPFYLDEDKEVMVIVIKSDLSVRVGVDAPRHYAIRRKEIPFD